ncbi:Rieske (2Fe-2S) protein [Nitrospina sp. 32_T5]|uniref:Rieske (2Fe-2S) protein n=1 Tax=unclassified Nitrospina TaxID=2638683 RepID=UPI003F9717E2
MAKYKVCKTSDLAEGQGNKYEVNGQDIAVYHVDGQFWATADFCPHRGGSLGYGRLDGKTVICPSHGWQFDITTGECLNNVSGEVNTFEVSVEGDDVFVELP